MRDHRRNCNTPHRTSKLARQAELADPRFRVVQMRLESANLRSQPSEQSGCYAGLFLRLCDTATRSSCTLLTAAQPTAHEARQCLNGLLVSADLLPAFTQAPSFLWSRSVQPRQRKYAQFFLQNVSHFEFKEKCKTFDVLKMCRRRRK